MQPKTKYRFQIIPASWRDLTELRHLEQICFPKDAWPLFDLIAVLSFPNVIRLKAEVDGKMAGFIAGDLRSSKNIAWIATIGVFPEYRRWGIATALLEECEAELGVSRIKLSVRAENESAIILYKKLGYQRVGIWTAYYQDGGDAIVFEKIMGSTL